MAQAAPDGYTIIQTGVGQSAVAHGLDANLKYDSKTDFIHLTQVHSGPNVLVVNTQRPFKNVKELVTFAKANPGKLTYGSTGTPTSPHLTTELVAQKAGIELQHVPYKGSADLMLAVLSGQLMAAADSTGFAPQVEAGKLRVLNTWGDKRLAKFPDAPTLKELGYDTVQNSPFGIGAPKGTPPEVVQKVHDAFKKAMDDPRHAEVLKQLNQESWYRSGADYALWAKDTFAKDKVLIDRLGLAAQ